MLGQIPHKKDTALLQPQLNMKFASGQLPNGSANRTGGQLSIGTDGLEGAQCQNPQQNIALEYICQGLEAELQACHPFKVNGRPAVARRSNLVSVDGPRVRMPTRALEKLVKARPGRIGCQAPDRAVPGRGCDSGPPVTEDSLGRGFRRGFAQRPKRSGAFARLGLLLGGHYCIH